MSNQPNVLVLLSDQHSFRYLGANDASTGYSAKTPTLDRLARLGNVVPDGVYRRADLHTIANQNINCLTSPRCGGWHNASLLKEELPTFPEAFSAAGYDTCLLGKMHLGGNDSSASARIAVNL